MLTLGIDLGTSGVRAVVPGGASGSAAIVPAQRTDPATLWAAVAAVLEGMELSGIQALAVDGTSGTLLPVAADGTPLGPLSLYNDPSPAHARIHALGRRQAVHRVLHEADWVAGQFWGRWDTTDENNALKSGYDPALGAWKHPAPYLPRVVPAGTALGSVTLAAAARFGLPRDALAVAGTTDGCASFLSTGAGQPGDAVTALGSTLTLKVLSPTPVTSAAHGVYSHRVRGQWLAGGASNTGGAVLAHHFTPAQLAALSERMDPARDSGLDYYPLLHPGERFPRHDPALQPRLLPRPADDALFLHGLLEGIARIEAEGYRLLQRLGAPPPRRVLTVGGGAANPAWTALRQRILGVPVRPASSSAAHGAALLARPAPSPSGRRPE